MNDTQIMETIHGCFEEMVVAINGRLDQMQAELKAGLHEELKRHEERLDRIEVRLDRIEVRLDRIEERLDRVEERLDRVEEHLKEHDKRLDALDRKLTELSLHVENETDSNIRLLAENHIELVNKLNEGIDAANNNRMYAIQVGYLIKNVDKLKEEVEDLKKGSIIRRPRRRVFKSLS